MQIARAAAIFHVDEVVIYGDPSVKGGRGNWDATPFFARLLQYVETPQYLRKVGLSSLSRDPHTSASSFPLPTELPAWKMTTGPLTDSTSSCCSFALLRLSSRTTPTSASPASSTPWTRLTTPVRTSGCNTGRA